MALEVFPPGSEQSRDRVDTGQRQSDEKEYNRKGKKEIKKAH